MPDQIRECVRYDRILSRSDYMPAPVHLPWHLQFKALCGTGNCYRLGLGKYRNLICYHALFSGTLAGLVFMFGRQQMHFSFPTRRGRKLIKG